MCPQPGEAFVRSFPPAELHRTPAAIAQARGYVRECLDGAEVDPVRVDFAVLLASELVTNAVMHAVPLALAVHLTPERIRVAVSDSSPEPPMLQKGDQGEGGWGLQVVERASADWGHHTVAGGKCVWFELAR